MKRVVVGGRRGVTACGARRDGDGRRRGCLVRRRREMAVDVVRRGRLVAYVRSRQAPSSGGQCAGSRERHRLVLGSGALCSVLERGWRGGQNWRPKEAAVVFK